ncbi:YidB family protein [Mycoplana azooxidifex]|uniref:YidB family protein n=1 Tax=Mycoplana azooxidifex TaxID=1636188 RepID=UPI001611C65D
MVRPNPGAAWATWGRTGEGTGGGFGGLGDLLGGLAEGGLSGGLADLLRQFDEKGRGETVKPWVQPGENRPIDGHELSDVLGPNILNELSSRTGLTPDEILSRLSRDLPSAVDELTPNGQFPRDDDNDVHA